MTRPIKIFHDMAKALNCGNSVAVCAAGIEPGITQGSLSGAEPVKSGWYLGPYAYSQNYQRRITAPNLERELVRIADGMWMCLRISVIDQVSCLECIVAKNRELDGIMVGVCPLTAGGDLSGGLTSDPLEGFRIIEQAVKDAFAGCEKAQTIIASDKMYPVPATSALEMDKIHV